MIRITILASLLLVNIAQVQAAASGYSYEDGSGLLQACNGDSNFDLGVCHSYLIGIHDAHGSLAYSGLLPTKRFCTPEGAEVGVLKEAFMTYASTHPENLQRTASSLVIDAFGIAFPCN